MNRSHFIQQLETIPQWDVLIIGGGATGLGIAMDAASRGYNTLLLERNDFACGTSSRSTKLVHGGVRYLAQGDIALVRHALRERGLLLRNAPHVCHKLAFVLPVYSWWRKLYYGLGLKVYDILSGKLSLGATKFLSSKKVMEYLPSASAKGLKGGVLYYDGQFDDARLAVNMAQTAVEHGAAVINHITVTAVQKQAGRVNGVTAVDAVTGRAYSVAAKTVINATGVFADAVMNMDAENHANLVMPSQGAHLVVDKKFFPGGKALMIPKTDDGRVLFAIPWNGKAVLGTTDTPVPETVEEPRALEEEISFIINHFNRYTTAAITRNDVLSVFTGLRPLVKKKDIKKTSALSRDHTIMISASGMVTITGGKWTTWRKMAKDALDKTIAAAGWPFQPCRTETIAIHGCTAEPAEREYLSIYGSDAEHIERLERENPALGERLHPSYPFTRAQVVWAVREEMALTVEDVLSRRLRLLLLDARAAMEAAPETARLMAAELNADEHWSQEQVHKFNTLAKKYVLV
jgi:glycerol-3-phosphate dehydrogenase